MTHPGSTREQVLDALRADPSSIRAIAKVWSIHHNTVMRWARAACIKVPSAADRLRAGQVTGNARRWGKWEKRRRNARKLHAKGNTLAEIAAAVGYKSVASVHYALK